MKITAAGLTLLLAASQMQGSSTAQTAKLKPYSVSPGFKNVANYAAMQKKVKLTPEQQQMLAKNLLVARPGDLRQLFHVYENNDYLSLPSFVTTDSVLQLYHIFFDYTLRTAETKSFLPELKKLTTSMLAASVEQWKAAEDIQVKNAALRNVAYFAVADRMLGLTDEVPDDALPMARTEMELAAKHEGFSTGAIFPYKIDYSQFVPRGHYTRSADLRRYFGAMMWYGLAPFAARDDKGKPSTGTILQGLLWTRIMADAKLAAQWEKVYEPTSFYVGTADDLTPTEFRNAATAVFGANATLEDYAEADKIAAFATEIQKVRAARIQANFGLQHGIPASTPNMIQGPFPGGAQLRFMGQRYIPDSEVLQRLSAPIARVFPSGLDVMAALGNDRAAQILDAYPQIYNANNWAGYKPERAKLKGEFAKLPGSIWTSNLYWGWLDALRLAQQPAPTGYPSFMKTVAWRDKSLNTALASWAELRHDTILYGKQSVVQCGDGGEEPPFVKGYVEPNVPFYNRLLALTKQSRQGLEARKLLPEDLKQKFENFEDLLAMLKRFSEKELRGEKLTKEEYLEIRYLGGKLEYMTVSVITAEGSEGRATWELLSETERNMAVVADVHTGGDKVLEEGVGHASEIYVLVPIEGKLYLTRGAVFSYYEFKHPISDRLTDEKWQALLKAGKAPAAPVWTKNFLAPGAATKTPNSELEAYNSGC